MKKTVVTSLSAIMAITVLAACGKDSTGGEAKDTHKAVTHDPVKLVVQNGYNADDEAQFMQDYGNLITKKYPYISFEYSPLKEEKNRITAGGDIDIVMTSVGLTQANLLDYNLQFDISDLIKKNNVDLNRLEPTTLQMQRNFANGGIYGLPVNTVTLNLFYTKNIFDKFGVAYPKDDMTWDDIYEVAKKVSRSDGTTTYRGFDLSMGHYMRMNQFSFSYLDPKTNAPMFMSDDWKKIVDNFARFNQIPSNFSKNFGTINPALDDFIKNKNLAMIFMPSSTLMRNYNLEDLNQLNWDVVSGPYFKEKMGLSTQSYPLFFYIAANSKHKDDAFEVINYLTSDEFQLQQAQQGVMSILQNNPKVIAAFGENSQILKGKNTKALMPKKFAPPSPYNRYSSVVESPLFNAAKAVFLNTSDFNTAMRTAEDNANKAVKAKMAQ